MNGVKNYMNVDHRSCRRNFCSCEKKAWKKKFRLVRDSNPWPLRYRCSALPIKLTSQLGAGRWNWFVVNLWKDDEVKGSNPAQAWIFFRLSFRSCESCVYNCDDHPSFNSSLRSSHIWFSYIHNFIIILSRVYNEPIQRPAPSWLVSSIGRALHRYRRGQGFESLTSLILFFLGFLFTTAKAASINCNDLLSYNITPSINDSCTTTVQLYDMKCYLQIYYWLFWCKAIRVTYQT